MNSNVFLHTLYAAIPILTAIKREWSSSSTSIFRANSSTEIFCLQHSKKRALNQNKKKYLSLVLASVVQSDAVNCNSPLEKILPTPML